MMMHCWFFRLMISIAADSDKHVGRTTSGHMAQCAGCRQFYEHCRRLERGLRSQAGTWQRVSGQSSQRILARLDDAQPAGAQGFRRPDRMLRIRAGLAVAACIAVAAATTILLTRQPPESPVPPPLAASPIIPAGMNAPTAWIGLIERPLTAEVQSLTRDTESGIRFLVACLNVGLPADQTARPERPMLLQ